MAIGTFFHLELADRCNLKCAFCPPEGRTNELIDFDTAVGVMDVASNTSIHGIWYNDIQLNGNGEPFMHPRLFDVICEAKKRFPIVDFISNGSLMTKDKIKSLLETDIDVVAISLTGVDPKVYSKFQGSGIPYEQCEKQLVKVIENVKMLAKTRDEMGKNTYIRLRYIKSEDSASHFKDYLKFWKDTGVNEVYVTSLWSFKRTKKQRKSSYKVLCCGSAPRRYQVSADGEVFPCTSNYNTTRNYMGNIHETPLEKIISSDLFLNEKKARMSCDLNAVPKSCLTCENRCLREFSEQIRNMRHVYFIDRPIKTFIYKLFGPMVILFEHITRYKIFHELYLFYLRKSSAKLRDKFRKRLTMQ